MAFLILTPNRKVETWKQEFNSLDPKMEIRIWPEVGNPDEIDFILSWNHPMGEFLKYKNLKCVASLGAGVDHILKDPKIPETITITRVVDPLLAQSMAEYVAMAILNYYRKYDLYKTHQSNKQWKPEPAKYITDFTVGIMGLGEMGQKVAKKLIGLGFQINGWSEPGQKTERIKHFFGDEQLNLFLNKTNILVCLLPLTEKTKNILNKKTFEQLPKGAYVINVARGSHLVEDDLLASLEADHLSGACLDVFLEEPLPENHPFWTNPKIKVTPHIASITNPKSVAKQIIENYHRFQVGQTLLYQVDIKRGY